MDENQWEEQAHEIVGRGLARELGESRAQVALADHRAGAFRFELAARRSLSASGFKVLMAAVLVINLVVGVAFYLLGAWPVAGFCGLDVALVWWAFKSNYTSGRIAETLELTPARLTLTRMHPSGSTERFDFNPYWVRVRLNEQPDGRNQLRLLSHGLDFPFARFLSDDERRDFAESLTAALLAARSARGTYLD